MNPNILTIYFDGKEVFVNSVLLTLDSINTDLIGTASTNILNARYTSQWEIFIGPAPDWSKNTNCTPTPLLAADFNDRIKNHTNGGNYGSGVPDYGFSQFCNLSGEYIHLVVQGTLPTNTITACSLGIFGTAYFREQELEATIQIIAGETRTLQVEHIQAEYPLAYD